MANPGTHTAKNTNWCELCQKRFVRIKRHMITHTAEKPYICPLCQKSFAFGCRLKQHIRTHTGEKPHKCQLCQKSFADSGGLKWHMTTHTGEKLHSCQLCQKSCAKSSDVKKHMRTHTGEKPHRCQLCQKAFADDSTLTGHMRTHTGEKPYSCQLCQKSFAHSSYIKRHMRTHTGEKPHRCQLCQKAFADPSTLRKHKRRQSCEKSHKCQLCQKSFGNLKLHMITHSGEYPHRCQLCQKSFAQISSLQAHVRAQLCKKQVKVATSHNGGETCSRDGDSPYTLSISSDQKSELDAGKQPEDLEMRSEVTPDQSNQFVTFSSGYVADEPIGRFSQDIYPDSGGISGLSWRRGDGECLHISKTKSLAEGTVSLSKCFGCGMCDKLVETQKEFLEHFSRHRLSQPVDLFTDKCCIMFPHD